MKWFRNKVKRQTMHLSMMENQMLLSRPAQAGIVVALVIMYLNLKHRIGRKPNTNLETDENDGHNAKKEW